MLSSVLAGKAGVDFGGERRQFGFQRGGEILAPFGDAERGAVGRQPRLAFCPGQELGAVVGEGLGADDVEVAGLQGVGQVDEHADFERAPVESARLRTGAWRQNSASAADAKPRSTSSSTSSRRA